MNLEQKTALIIKELFNWDIEDLLFQSDCEEGKEYDFDASEAINTLREFQNKYLA